MSLAARRPGHGLEFPAWVWYTMEIKDYRRLVFLRGPGINCDRLEGHAGVGFMGLRPRDLVTSLACTVQIHKVAGLKSKEVATLGALLLSAEA